jgi:hypothetical protein
MNAACAPRPPSPFHHALGGKRHDLNVPMLTDIPLLLYGLADIIKSGVSLWPRRCASPGCYS